MSNKRKILTIVGGALTGGLAAASGIYGSNPTLLAVFSAASGLVGALIAYFGGE